MDEHRKRAYRWLLYSAFLEIRILCWIEAKWYRLLNPFSWLRLRSRSRDAGAIADWMHNLAIFSALEFARFDEDRFWKDYEWFVQSHAGLIRYREEFERMLLQRDLSGGVG